MKLPPYDEIRAVHQIVYDPGRLQKLDDLMCEIGTIMNMLQIPCGPMNIRNRGPNYGKGPTWYLLEGATLYKSGTPKLNPIVLDGADRCDKVAAVLLEMHAAMAHANVNASAKADIRSGLADLAASWQERGKMWRDPDAAHAAAQVKAISTHFSASVKTFERVRYYL